jgi:NADH-quinone oxidoreductase subunit M
MTWREGAVLAPLVALIVFLGVYPKPVLERMEPAVDRLIIHVDENSDFVSPSVDRPEEPAGEQAEGGG